MNILMTGFCAPPYGGEAVYIQRLSAFLRGKGHRCRVLDCHNKDGAPPSGDVLRVASELRLYGRILFLERAQILHINESNWRQRAVLTALARVKGMRSVLTLHSFRVPEQPLGRLKRLYIRFVLRYADQILSSGEREVQEVLRWVPGRTAIEWSPPFIPPSEEDLRAPLPEMLRQFIGRHRQVLCANGSNMDRYGGEDIYGLDLLADLALALREEDSVGIVYCLSDVGDPEYLADLLARLRSQGLEDRFLVYTGEVAFWQVIAASTAMIRPTRTDSYGISVAESLYLNRPVAASDVCTRPPGTVLFRSGDPADLVRAARQVLRMASEGVPVSLEETEGGGRVLRVYERLVMKSDKHGNRGEGEGQ